MTGLAAALSLTAGIAGGLQVAVMARLGERIGSLEAVAFAASVTTVIAAAVLLVVRQSWSGSAPQCVSRSGSGPAARSAH